METLRRTWAQFQTLVAGMAPSQRLTLVAVPVLVVGGLLAVMYSGWGVAEEHLLAGKTFSTEELRNAQEALQKSGLTQFRLDGQKILVPKADATRYNAALLANGGMPAAFGDELARMHEKVNWFTTDKERQELRELAKQRELAKLIKALPDVEDASVIWERSKSRPFGGSAGKVTATVSVRPRLGREISQVLVGSLRQAVAGAVADLAPGDVTVFNMSTGVAYRPEDPSDPFNSQFVEQVKQFTTRHKQAIVDGLKYIPNVIVSVNVDLDNLKDAVEKETTADAKPSNVKTIERAIVRLLPKAVQISVSIPKEYYREVARRQGESESDKQDFQARVQLIESETLKEIKEKVAKLVPVAAAGTAAEQVSVTSYVRLETDPPVMRASTWSHAGELAAQWGGPVWLALFTLWVLWTSHRGRKKPSQAPAASNTESGKPAGTSAEPTLPVEIAVEEKQVESPSIVDSADHAFSSAPFGFLKNSKAEDVIALMIEERPQTIALVLSYLPAHLAGEVLCRLPTPKQLEVIRRVADMEQTSSDVVRDVEKSLEKRMRSGFARQVEKTDRVHAVTQILNVADRMTNKSLLESLEREDPELVEQIRRVMFVFDDLAKVDDKAIRMLLKEFETSQWALALKGASRELKAKIMRNLSQRASAMLEEETQYLGPVRVSDVEATQQLIVDAVRRLEDAGEIVIAAGAGEKMIT